MKMFIFLIFYIFVNIHKPCAYETKIDSIFAVVNNQVILNSDINNFLFLLTHERLNTRVSTDKIVLKKQIIQKLIGDALLLDAADQKNIQITNEQVNQVIKRIASQKNITLKELQNNVLFHEENTLFTYQDYFENVKKQLKIQLIQEYELNKRINISEKEINFFLYKKIAEDNRYNDIGISYILLPSSEKTTNSIIKNNIILAKKMVYKIKHGYHFMSLYKKCMQHKSFFFVKTIPQINFLDLQKHFSNTLNIVQKGDVLGPFIEKNGLYILKINNIKNKKEKIQTEFHMQHCLIKFSPMTDYNAARKKIFKIYQNLKNKRYSFNYAVKKYSDDVYLYNQRGDLGWIPYKLLNNDFQKKILHLKNHSISEPVASNIGWHIFKLLNKRNTDIYYQIERDKVYRFLFNRRMKIEKNNWMQELKRSSYIHIIHG